MASHGRSTHLAGARRRSGFHPNHGDRGQASEGANANPVAFALTQADAVAIADSDTNSHPNAEADS